MRHDFIAAVQAADCCNSLGGNTSRSFMATFCFAFSFASVSSFVRCSAANRSDDVDTAESDLLQYSQTLGVDLQQHSDLLWVVQEAFNAPLPLSWTEYTDDEGRVYFFNQDGMMWDGDGWGSPLIASRS
eukprot:s15_g3.t1